MEDNNLGPDSNFIPKIYAGADTKLSLIHI